MILYWVFHHESLFLENSVGYQSQTVLDYMFYNILWFIMRAKSELDQRDKNIQKFILYLSGRFHPSKLQK